MVQKCTLFNFRDSELWILVNLGLKSYSNFVKLKFRTSKIVKIKFFDSLNSLKFDFTSNLSGGKLIKFQQSQALTSHFESFWSIVLWRNISKGEMSSYLSSFYRYLRGAWMSLHVDRLPTHVLSAILQVISCYFTKTASRIALAILLNVLP